MVALGLLLVAGCASGSETTEESAVEVKEKPSSKEAEKEGAADEEPAREAGDESEQEASKEPSTDKSTSAGPSPKQKTGGNNPRIQRAINLAQKGNSKRASNILNRQLEDAETGHLAAYNLGALQEKRGNISEAASHYNTALEKNPDFSPALINLVRLYIRQGRANEAESIAQKYIGKRSENLDHRAAQLELMLHKEQYNAVIRKAKDLLRRDETNVEAMVAMAKANYWMERYELSKAILQRASDLAPKRADIFFLFGLIAMETDNNQRAIANFEKALTLNGRLAEAHNNLGLMYYTAGDYKGAAQQFRAALEDFPDFKQAVLNLGNALKGIGKLKKAEAQFKNAIELDSEYADAYFNLGVLYLDGKMAGMDKIPRLQKSIEYLNEYKRISRGQLDESDPADKYIKSARKKIKAEKQRQKMMRQAQQPASSGSGSQSSGGGSKSSKDGKEKSKDSSK